jgi:hypothetical protein
MKESEKNYYQEEKAKKEFLIFDRGLTELSMPKTDEKKSKKKITWFLLYQILFKNILNSKEIIPLEELNLRFNIIRTSLPKYFKGYKGNNSNSSIIIKKFTYHISKNKKRSRSLLKSWLKLDDKTRLINSERKNENDRSLSFGKKKKGESAPNNLEKSAKLGSPNHKMFSIDSIKLKSINSNNLFNTDNNDKDDINEANKIILGTPSDAEFPLVLSQKRNFNTKPSFFYESLNKVKELTKQEKIKTFQKEFTSQILKFNDLYYDPKIDDFSNDKLFNDVKNTCDLFINRFNIDSDEEKNLAYLDNYI